MKKVITYSVAAIALVGVAVLLCSTSGVAVFFLPLLAGAFKECFCPYRARGVRL